MERKIKKFKEKWEGASDESNLEKLRNELYELIKKYGVESYEVMVKSREINNEIDKEMRRQINVEAEIKVFMNKNFICIQSKNYSIIYKDYKVYTGLIARSGKILWFREDTKIFSTTKEAFYYLLGRLEDMEENSDIL